MTSPGIITLLIVDYHAAIAGNTPCHSCIVETVYYRQDAAKRQTAGSLLFLLTGQKSGFSPRWGDSLHRFRSNFAVPTATWVRLAVQNFTSIGADGWECGPQNIKKIPLFGKESPCRATPLTDFENL